MNLLRRECIEGMVKSLRALPRIEGFAPNATADAMEKLLAELEEAERLADALAHGGAGACRPLHPSELETVRGGA